MEHLHVQLRLASLFEGANIEVPFPSIGRIADVACEELRIVFEIQYSPISLEEVEGRNRDYKSVGYGVVWILHDGRFNQKKLGAAEGHLRGTTCYYTDMDREGKGEIYDQFEVIKGGYRHFKGPRIVVNPAKIYRNAGLKRGMDLKLVKERVERWEYFVEGDLVSRLGGGEEGLSSSMGRIEKRILEQGLEKCLPWRVLLRKGYEAVLNKLLEKF